MNIKKKTLFAIPILLGIVFSFGICTSKAKAETFNGTIIESDHAIPNAYVKRVNASGYMRYEQLHFLLRSTDNTFVYCLQPFVLINNDYTYNVAYSDYATFLNMTQEQWDRISLLAYYGYNYKNHTDPIWYAITQVLIWRTAEPTTDTYFTNSANGNRNDNLYAAQIAELENLVAMHNKMPKLSISNTTLALGQTITLNDTNGVLHDFKVKENTNLQATITNNSISITATGVGKATLKLAKEDSMYSTPPIVYFKEETQDVFSVGSFDPLYSSINLNVVGGRIEMTKMDKDTGKIIPQGLATLTGAEYGIYDAETNELIQTLITDDNAFSRSDYLPKLGKFYLQEIKPSKGYQLDTQKYYFTIDENNLLVKLNVYEEVIKRGFEFTKVYASNKTGIMTPEAGVQFAIYDHNNNLISIETTDEEGKIYVLLTYGNYTLRQLTSPSGYEKIEDYLFEVRDLGPDINKVFSNAEITARLKVVKVDQNGNRIAKAGIKFKIKNLSTDKYVCQTTFYPTPVTYCEFETNKDGVLITPYPLNTGNYQLEEVDQIIDGYVWNSTPLLFTIDENSDIEKTDDFDAILEIHFENQEVKGIIEIQKVGEKLVIENGTYTYKEIPLPKVVFGLYDESMNLIKTLETDDNGLARFENLKLGKYIIKEISTTGNHILDNKEYEFILEYIDQYTPIVKKTYTLKNYLGKGSLEITKADVSTGELLPNALFEVYNANTDELIFSGRTDKNGKIIIKNLGYGKYYFLEKEAPENYILNEEKMYFEILENNQIIKSTVHNKKVEMPNTFNTDITNLIRIGSMALIGLGILLYAKKKDNK
ncbi:MAG: Cys-Gln thioester bond-forming surface protein [Bacilli bacterium]|nr:Cys-Gln thioester bond-forming surface protein [Bacilli bacterium]